MRPPILLLSALLALAGPLAAQAPVAEPDEAVRPGDVVKLRIWQEPELSGEFTVDEDGLIVVPKLGPVQAGGVARADLRERLVAGFSVYLVHTSIEVTVLRRIQVLGAVRNPGLYPVDATMTIADVLALAGGTGPDGRLKRVELIRAGERLAVRLTGAERVGDTPIRSGDQLFVPQRGWMDRNAGVVTGVLSTGAGVLLGIFN